MASPVLPQVSVIMPCLNAARTLKAAISSVQAQTCTEWELLLADDGSGDDSVAVARGMASEDARIRVLSGPERPSGAAAARNRALDAARGRYIAFLDADDLWLPRKLELQLALMQETGCAFVFGAYILRPIGGRKERVLIPPACVTREDLLRGNKVGCLTAMYDSAVLGKSPMPALSRRHDYALWLELLTRTSVARAVLEPVAIHCRQPGSLSSNVLKSTWGTWVMLRTSAKLSRPKALRTLVLHLWQRVWR